MILQLFSGGWDSTYLAFQNLKQQKDTTLLYINSNNIGDVDEIQKNCAIKVHEKYLNHLPLEIWEFSVPMRYYHINVAQSVLFTIAAFFYVANFSQTFEEVQMGDIMGDDSISFLEERQQLWESLFKTTSLKAPKLTTPLKKVTKQEVLLFLADKNLLWETSFCENHYKDNYYCGKCPSCKKVRYLLEDTSLFEKTLKFEDKEIELRYKQFRNLIHGRNRTNSRRSHSLFDREQQSIQVK